MTDGPEWSDEAYEAFRQRLSRGIAKAWNHIDDWDLMDDLLNIIEEDIKADPWVRPEFDAWERGYEDTKAYYHALFRYRANGGHGVEKPVKPRNPYS